MELKDLTPAEGSTKARKRVGRGGASGRHPACNDISPFDYIRFQHN